MAGRSPSKNVGLISSIDPDQHKMNIEILPGMKKLTMTGTLNSNTVFIENGHPAALADFKEGDVVLVQWSAATNDKSIEFVRKGAEVTRFMENKYCD
jgi:hypothetical protein